MGSLISNIRNLGLLQGVLAQVSAIKGSRHFETRVLRRLDPPFLRSRYGGVKLRSNWPDLTFRLCLFAEYGYTLSDLLKGQSKPFVFLDIGANQGLYSLIAGRNPCCRAAIAFEPVPDTFALLEANVAANGLRGRVSPVDRAIASENGTATIRIRHNHSGTASLATSNDFEGREATIHMIDHDGMDALIPDGPEPILVKIDVEGFEPVVVAELIRSRHRDRMSVLFYEIDEQWVDPAAIEQSLRGIGFATFRKISDDPAATHYDVLATR